MRLTSRTEAGRALAVRLEGLAGAPEAVVIGLPRGGVVVAAEIAEALGVPLDVLIVRKLGVPWQPELAMGAIASGGETFLNEDLIAAEGVTGEELAAAHERELGELHRREKAYRGDRPPLDLRGKTAILVDDGLATGATMEVAIRAARRLGAVRVVVAVAVAPPQAVRALRHKVEEVVVLLTPEPFGAIGVWYDDFAQTSDEQVRELLSGERRAAQGH